MFYFTNLRAIICLFNKSTSIRNFFSNSDLSVPHLVFKTNSLVSILFTLVANLLYTAFLATSFLLTSLNLRKPTRTGTKLSKFNLSTSAFKLAKFVFRVTLGCQHVLRSVLLHNLKKSILTLMFLPKFLKVLSHFYTMSFLSIKLLNELS